MKKGDKIKIRLDENIYEYGEFVGFDVDLFGHGRTVSYIDGFGNEKEAFAEFVELDD